MNNIARIVVEGLKIIDPSVKGVDLLQALAEYVNDRNIEKMDRINEKLLKDEATQYEKDQILNGGIDKEDYLSFIRAAVNDDESQKETIYITLYRNILNGKVSNGKVRLYKILKELPYSALELLPKMYIYKHCNTQKYTIFSYIESISNNEDLSFEFNLLIQFGLLKNIQLNTSVISNGNNIQLSNQFDSIVELFFKPKELMPHYQKIPIWTKKAFILADIEEDDLFYIEKLLNENAIRTVHYSIIALRDFKMFNDIDHVICILNKKEIPTESKAIIKKYSEIYKTHKVCINENIQDQLPELKNKLIKIKKYSKEDEFHFLSNFNVKTIDLF